MMNLTMHAQHCFETKRFIIRYFISSCKYSCLSPSFLGDNDVRGCQEHSYGGNNGECCESQ